MAETEAEPQPMEVEPQTTGDKSDDHRPISVSENPNNTSDSTSSDSDSDSDDEAQLNLEVQSLETQLSNNPSDYDAHVKYIKVLRKQGDIEKLRQAREAMSALFPLSPDMWQEWVRDEATISSKPEAVPEIEKLYEQGVSDYLSVALWIDYVNFVQERDPLVQQCSANGISKTRNLFERAITAAGLHVTKGSKVYESYRELEQAILLTLGEADSESKEKQVQRIRNLFFRQLSVPLTDMRTTLLTYKAWEAEQGSTVDVDPSSTEGLPSNIVFAYHKALEMLNLRTNFEEQIARKDASDSERLQEFMTYLDFEQSAGDPARVQVLYERAVTEFPISADLWLKYTRYIDKTIKTSSIVKDVYARATRNCPWVGELWTKYLLHLEHNHAFEEEISAVFEKSLQCTFTSYDEYLDLYLTRVDGLRRRSSSASKMGDSFDFSVIRDVFQRASDYLSPYLKNTESFLRMYSYWSHLELNLGKNMTAARAVWESLLKISGSILEAWQGYIAMEISAGNINEARSLYKRCYTKRFSGTGSEDICHSWMRFEREYGSLEDYEIAVLKVTPRLAELQVFRMQQESKSTGTTTDQRGNLMKKSTREKRKMDSDITNDQSRAKRQKDTTHHLKMNIEKDNIQAADSEKKDIVEGGKINASKLESTSKKETNDPSPNKVKHFKDQCTAFISNLNFKTTAEDLCAFFGDGGGVGEIRILKDKYTGKSRGLAYVDFVDDSHLTAALAKNKRNLQGKRLSILRSDPQGKRKGTVGRSNTSGAADKQTSDQPSDSKDGSGSKKDTTTSQKRSDDNVQLKGRNTFAMPRSVRPLGWTKTEPGGSEEAGADDEKPKSNDEFRKMLMKKET